MKLYEITGELAVAITKYEEAQTEEELLELEKTINSIELSFTDKALAVAFYTRNLLADVTAIENEVNRLTALKKRAQTRKEWFEKYLKASMDTVGIPRIENATLKISIKKNPASVVIDNEQYIPHQYMRVIPERLEPDKIAIKDAWKQGIGVSGTHIEDNKTHLEIK